jgi:hypothetical protein
MSQQQHYSEASKESQIWTALLAIKQDEYLFQRRAAAIYSVSRRILGDRRAGRPL